MSFSCKYPPRDKGIIILNHLQPQVCNVAGYICTTLFAKIILSSLEKHSSLKKKKKIWPFNHETHLWVYSYLVHWIACYFALKLCPKRYLYYYCFKNLGEVVLSFTEIRPNHWNQVSNADDHRHSMVREDFIRFVNDSTFRSSRCF